MPTQSHSFTFRVRYAETDQMGSYYNGRALEWFELGRSELSRVINVPYTEWESKGVYLPLIEAYVRYQGRAQYDDLLEMTLHGESIGHTRLRFPVSIVHAESRKPVCKGHTVHALINKEGRPMRIPDWVRELYPTSDEEAR